MTSLGTGRQTLGDRYELQSLIATGGMGQVWRGRDRLLDRPVAVKVLRSEYADDRVFLERFRSEARHAAALSHPNIAAVLDYGESADADTGEHLAYLVMELVDGAPLSERLEREGPLEPDAALSVLRQTAAGLAEAHRAGLVHRDVKPANILVRPDGRVKLTDFGIAWSAESVPLTGTGQVIGTARYMSPEQAAGERVSPASDVYALGLVGYESLTGHPPFEGTNPVTVALKQVREQPQPLPAAVPAEVRSLIDAALVKDPGARPRDAGAFLSAVEETIARTTRPQSAALLTAPVTVVPVPAVPVPAAPVEPPASGAPRRRRGALLLAPLLAVVVAGLLAVLLWPGGSGGGRTPAQAATPTGATGESAAAATSIVLAADDHVGRPADEVAAELTALGLTVDRRTEETTAVEAGAVAALDPVGVPLRPGDPVTLTVAATPSAPAPGGGVPGGPVPAGPVPAGAEGGGTPPSDRGPARAPSRAPASQAPPAGAPSAGPPAAEAPAATTPPDPAPTTPPDPAPSPGAPSDPAPTPSAPSDPAPTPSDPPPVTPEEPAPSTTVPPPPEPEQPEPEQPEPEQPEPEQPAEPPAPGSATSSAPAGAPADPGAGAAG